MKTFYTSLCALTLLGHPIQAKPNTVDFGLCRPNMTSMQGRLDDSISFTYTQNRKKDVVRYYDSDSAIVLTVDKKHGNCYLAKIERQEFDGKKYQTVSRVKRKEREELVFSHGRSVYHSVLSLLERANSQ